MDNARMLRNIVKAYRRYDIDQQIGHFRAYRRLYRTLSSLALDIENDFVSTLTRMYCDNAAQGCDIYVERLEQERRNPRMMGATRAVLETMRDILGNMAQGNVPVPTFSPEMDVMFDNFLQGLVQAVQKAGGHVEVVESSQ